jgi:hypothetical protein
MTSSVSLADARKAVETAQSAPISMPDVDESWVTLSSAFGDFKVRIVRPPGSMGLLPAILYTLIAKQRGSVQFAHQSLYYPLRSREATSRSHHDSESTRAAISLAITALRRAFGTEQWTLGTTDHGQGSST